jgi:hypothetical protein
MGNSQLSRLWFMMWSKLQGSITPAPMSTSPKQNDVFVLSRKGFGLPGTICHSLAYQNYLPSIWLWIMDCVKILNYFPTKGGLSISPRLLMARVGRESKKHFRVPFGSYCQVHEDDTPRNSMLPRTAGAICLGHRVTYKGGTNSCALGLVALLSSTTGLHYLCPPRL